MTRAKSVILTPTERKLAVSMAKDLLTKAGTSLTKLNRDRVMADRDIAAKLKTLKKEYEATVAAAVKAHAETCKLLDREIKAVKQAHTHAESDLLKLNPTVAPSQKTAPESIAPPVDAQ